LQDVGNAKKELGTQASESGVYGQRPEGEKRSSKKRTVIKTA